MNWSKLDLWEKIIVVAFAWMIILITIAMFFGERGC